MTFCDIQLKKVLFSSFFTPFHRKTNNIYPVFRLSEQLSGFA